MIREEVYPDGGHRKIAISDINGTTFRRFYFFKVTSADSHYESNLEEGLLKRSACITNAKTKSIAI